MKEKNNNYKDFYKSKNFNGYSSNKNSKIDELISLIDFKTPCGEFFRRYWHPVALTSEVDDKPIAVKILGEKLILFKTKKKEYGLVHKQCPHRNASLIYGKCEQEGIRCCYHGWLFAPDGKILETPGEEKNSKEAKNIRERTRLGAYPVIEFNGIIFTYMGPIDDIPEFPYYDTFLLDGMQTRPYRVDYNCNWLQVLDAIMDPIHTSFLHSTISGAQFSRGLGEIGELEIFQRGLQFLGSNTRRVNEHVWVRVNELILPNFTQAGAAFAADGTKTRLFGRSSFTRWVVPIDNTHTMALAWGNFGDRGDPLEYNSQEGCELIEQGEVINRTWEEKQSRPSDAEAVEGMGPISQHKNEHLMPTDQGILLYRREIKKLIRDLQNGKKPPQPQQVDKEPIRTNGQDTVLFMPKKNDDDDRNFLRQVGSTVLNIQFDAEKMSLDNRDEYILKKLKELEENYIK